MTPEGYRAAIRDLGYTPHQPSVDGQTVHVNRDGQFSVIPDAQELTPIERQDFITLLMSRHLGE
jgi:hypothetical protein